MCRLTTFDNPYDPFTQFDLWFAFDVEKGYYSCSRLARVAKISEEMTEKERKDLETKIDALVDELKPLNEMLDSIVKKEIETENRIYKYMRENLTEKELKKARTHGW